MCKYVSVKCCAIFPKGDSAAHAPGCTLLFAGSSVHPTEGMNLTFAFFQMYVNQLFIPRAEFIHSLRSLTGTVQTPCIDWRLPWSSIFESLLL